MLGVLVEQVNMGGKAGVMVLVMLALASTAITYGAAVGLKGYHKNIFVGTGYQWCSQKLNWSTATCNEYLGASASDILVMKWNAQWVNCNANGYSNPKYCLGAWEDNEWNGQVANGDGGVWHYKIIWVGSQAENSTYWIAGGESVWSNYEVIMDQGTSNGAHTILAHTTPNGYGTS